MCDKMNKPVWAIIQGVYQKVSRDVDYDDSDDDGNGDGDDEEHHHTRCCTWTQG